MAVHRARHHQQAVGIDPATKVRVTFSTNLRQSTVSGETFRVVGSHSGQRAGTLEIVDRQVVFTPSTPFTDGGTLDCDPSQVPTGP